MEETILVVDDEKEIADLIEVYLENDGYRVKKFYNAADALACLEHTRIDLALLDIMLPDMDGFTLCQKIRTHLFFPIIMLTAKCEDADKTSYKDGLTEEDITEWKKNRSKGKEEESESKPAPISFGQKRSFSRT